MQAVVVQDCLAASRSRQTTSLTRGRKGDLKQQQQQQPWQPQQQQHNRQAVRVQAVGMEACQLASQSPGSTLPHDTFGPIVVNGIFF